MNCPFGRSKQKIVIIEIESTEIIAYYASNQKRIKGNLILPYQKIREICEKLEINDVRIQTCYDMISIDAFRCSFPDNVVMERNQLVIKKISDIQSQLSRLLPPKEIVEMIEQINKCKNEKNS